jgi:DNA-binding transcriptional MerR regulator
MAGKGYIPRTLEQIKKADKVIKGELAKLTGLKLSTLEFYTEAGLLDFEQQGEKSRRLYKRAETLQRIREIQKLKDRRYTIEEIKERICRS